MDRVEALEWVLGKLSAPRVAQPKAPVFKPPVFKPPQPAAPKLPAPVVETPAQKQKRLTELRGAEEELWRKWVDSGKKPDIFEQLKKSHAPILNRHLSRFKGVEVNKAAQRSILLEHYYKQLETWDPDHPSKARLNTWVESGLRGIKRFVVKHQNPARITEPLSQKITPYRVLKTELTEKLGYEPTDQQIADSSKGELSLKDVLQVSKQVRRSYDISGGGEEVEGAGLHANDPWIQAAHVVFPELKPHEQKVHELMFPRGGSAPVTKSGAIAKRLKWEVSKVSKAKRVILEKIQERVGD